MTDHEGRKFYYTYPRCGRDVEGCPDPACRYDRVGHHVVDGDCVDDVPLADCGRRHPEPPERPEVPPTRGTS